MLRVDVCVALGVSLDERCIDRCCDLFAHLSEIEETGRIEQICNFRKKFVGESVKEGVSVRHGCHWICKVDDVGQRKMSKDEVIAKLHSTLKHASRKWRCHMLKHTALRSERKTAAIDSCKRCDTGM